MKKGVTMKTEWIKYLEPLAISVFAVFAPIQGILITVGVVIFMDMITGVMAASKRNEKISSAALRRSLSKLLVYHCALLTGFLIETYLMDGLIPITKIIAATCGSIEGLSLLENLNTISGTNLLQEVIAKLGSKNDVQKLDTIKIKRHAKAIIKATAVIENTEIKEENKDGNH